jgi:hypothetical protein
MRSKWEVAYAQYLDKNAVAWQYEPRWFNIGKGNWRGKGYLPDFYLVKKKAYVEVKGRYLKRAQNKIAAFRKQYPKIKLELLQASELKLLGVIDMRGFAILK